MNSVSKGENYNKPLYSCISFILYQVSSKKIHFGTLKNLKVVPFKNKKRKSSIYGTNKNQNKKDPFYYVRCLNRI